MRRPSETNFMADKVVFMCSRVEKFFHKFCIESALSFNNLAQKFHLVMR